MDAPRHSAPARRKSWLSLLPLAGPLAIFSLLGWLLLAPKTPEPERKPSNPPAADSPAAAPAGVDWQAVDLDAAPPGEVLQGWMAEQGAFVLRSDMEAGGQVLEQKPEPMTEGIYRSWTRFSHGGIRARVSGESHRRAPPRFSIGLEGRRAFHLRAAPAHNRLELVTPPEVMLVEAPWEWKKDRKLWLELVCLPAPGGGARIEARAWPEGEPRPAEPSLTRLEKNSPGRLSPSVRGGPFALKPLLTDRISILKLD